MDTTAARFQTSNVRKLFLTFPMAQEFPVSDEKSDADQQALQ
jgi:hypothetical protein